MTTEETRSIERVVSLSASLLSDHHICAIPCTPSCRSTHIVVENVDKFIRCLHPLLHCASHLFYHRTFLIHFLIQVFTNRSVLRLELEKGRIQIKRFFFHFFHIYISSTNIYKFCTVVVIKI